MKRGTRIFALSLAAMLALPAVRAHHSVAMFDGTRSVTVTGTVDHWEWTNPHAWVWVKVPQANGGGQIWGFECASLGMLRRMGFTKNSFQPGQKVTITGSPLSSGKPGGMFRRASFADGRVLGFGGGPPPAGGGAANPTPAGNP